MKQEQAKVGLLMYGGKGYHDGDGFLFLKNIKKVKGAIKYVFDYYEIRGKKQLYMVKDWTTEPHELSWRDALITTSKQKRLFIKEVVFGNKEKEID